MLGGPLGAMIGGALGSQVGEPVWEKTPGANGRAGGFQRLVGRCPGCGRIVSFRPGEAEVECPSCGLHLRAGPGVGDFRHERAFGADPRHAQDQAQSTFMVALISLAAKVAKADGNVTPEEVRSLTTSCAPAWG